jgi:hypothetical protein
VDMCGSYIQMYEKMKLVFLVSRDIYVNKKELRQSKFSRLIVNF